MTHFRTYVGLNEHLQPYRILRNCCLLSAGILVVSSKM